MEWLQSYSDLGSHLLSLLSYDASAPITLAGALFLFLYSIFGLGYLAVRRVRLLRTIYVVLFSLFFYYKLSGVYVLLSRGGRWIFHFDLKGQNGKDGRGMRAETLRSSPLFVLLPVL